MVGIFPEGPFSQEGRLVRGQPGTAMLALRAGVPVVPAAIEGTYEALRGRRFYLPRRRPARRPVRRADPLRPGAARAHRAGGARGGHPSDHGRDRCAPARAARPRRGRRPRGRLVTAAGTPPGKAWAGRFAEGPIRPPKPSPRPCPSTGGSGRTISIGSAAWARALARAELITEAELDGLLAGLDGVRARARGRHASRSGASSRTST